MKKQQTLEEYKKKINKKVPQEEIKLLAIPWSGWNVNGYAAFDTFNHLLTSMFVDLLDLVKEKEIKISCGVAMMQLLSYYTNYSPCTQKIHIGGCEVIIELDFNLGKHELAYNGIILVGQNIKSKIDNTQVVNEAPPSPNKKKSIWERIFG